MLKIKLREDLCNFAWDTVNKKNFGNRKAGANGNKEQQYTGILGEAVIYDLVCNKLPTYDESGLVDIHINDKKIDIKTMGRTVYMKDFYVHNFVGYQMKFENNIYLFNSIMKKDRMIEICGWMNRLDFLNKASFFDRGTVRTRSDGSTFETKAPLYEIQNKELNEINSVEDLKRIGL